MNFILRLPGGDASLFAIVLLSVFVAVWAFGQFISPADPRRRLLARALATRQRLHPVRRVAPSIAARDRLGREGPQSGLDRLADRFLPKADHWRHLLARAGTPLTLGSFAIFAAGLAVLLGAGLSMAGLAPIFAWPGGVVLAVLLLRLYLARLIRRRVAAFLKLLPDAIGLMVRGLRSGLPVTETIMAASREVRDPLGEELRRVSDQIQLGRALEDVMTETAQRIDLPEIGFMAVAFVIQRETGGNLAEMLENLDNILRRRRHMQLKVRAFSSEARASAMIIGALPFVLLGLLAVVNTNYISTLFTTSMGHILLASAGGCIALGIGALVKLSRFPI